MARHNLGELCCHATALVKLLPADTFPRKSEELLGGNRPRSSIELEVRKATKKSCSMPQSRRPLMQAIQCLNESLGASEVDGTFPMPSTITQDWVPSSADIKKQVKFKCYQAHNEFIPTENASALNPDAARLGMSLTGSYPVKVSAIKGLETLFRDTSRYYLMPRLSLLRPTRPCKVRIWTLKFCLKFLSPCLGL